MPPVCILYEQLTFPGSFMRPYQWHGCSVNHLFRFQNPSTCPSGHTLFRHGTLCYGSTRRHYNKQRHELLFYQSAHGHEDRPRGVSTASSTLAPDPHSRVSVAAGTRPDGLGFFTGTVSGRSCNGHDSQSHVNERLWMRTSSTGGARHDACLDATMPSASPSPPMLPSAARPDCFMEFVMSAALDHQRQVGSKPLQRTIPSRHRHHRHTMGKPRCC